MPGFRILLRHSTGFIAIYLILSITAWLGFRTFLLDASEPGIRRKIPLSLITKDESGVEDLEEYIITVYTGDKRGAGTDANVHIILFGDKDSSELIQLNKSLDHRDPFERGKVNYTQSKCAAVMSYFSSLRMLNLLNIVS